MKIVDKIVMKKMRENNMNHNEGNNVNHNKLKETIEVLNQHFDCVVYQVVSFNCTETSSSSLDVGARNLQRLKRLNGQGPITGNIEAKRPKTRMP